MRITVTAAALGDTARARTFLDSMTLDAEAIAACAAGHVDNIPRWKASYEVQISGGPRPELHTSYRYDNAFLGLCFSDVGSFGLSEPTNGPTPAFRLDVTLAAQRTVR